MKPASHSRRIVVTGCTRGIGRAMLDGFIEARHRVAGCGRNADAVAGLRAEFDSSAHDFSAVDVSNDTEVAAWISRLLSDWGVPDLLINNAAVMNPPGPLWEMSVSDVERMSAVNLNGVVHCIRHLVPAMIGEGRGVIVNLSSGWGRSTAPNVALYCMSKWGIEGLSQALAQELPSGLACVALNPGIIHTDMLESCWGSEAASFPGPSEWGQRAVPMILGLREKHNGQSLSVG